MSELTDPRFLNPVWHALHGPHRHLAIGSGAACRRLRPNGVAEGRSAAPRREGHTSWLHVSAPNVRAIELYGRLGFQRVRNLMLRRISRTD
jgi:hypothetical protein